MNLGIRLGADSIKLRPCVQANLEGIQQIEEQSFAYPYSRSEFERLLRLYPESFIVAELGDRLAGYLVCSVESESGTIVSLCVAPEFRRMGVASALLNGALEALKLRVRRVRLQVGISNEAAIRLYSDMGFKVRGKINGYYPDGEDALLMMKEL